MQQDVGDLLSVYGGLCSLLFSAVVCWGSSIRASDTNRLNKLIKKASSVIGCKQDTLEALVERRTLKLLNIMDNPLHPLHLSLVKQRSAVSKRLLQLRCHNNRYRKHSLPQTITSYNNSLCGNIIAHSCVHFGSVIAHSLELFIACIVYGLLLFIV